MPISVHAPSHGPLRDFLMETDEALAEAVNRTWAIADRQIHGRQTRPGGNDSGAAHVIAVETNIWRLLNETNDRSRGKQKNLIRFSPVDLYLLSCAACCHDFDKGLTKEVLSEDFKHGKGSGSFILDHWQELNLISEAAAEYLDLIVGIHDAKADFDNRLQDLPESYVLNNESGSLRRIAALFKAADTLHMDESRVSGLAVPDKGLQGIDKQKQLVRKSIHGWRPDGERIIVRFSARPKAAREDLKEFKDFFCTQEWPTVGRNLQTYGFPYRLEFEGLDLDASSKPNTRSSILPPRPDFETLTGREADLIKLKEKIGVAGEVIPTRMIFIWGVPGVGKTTLLQVLGHDEDVGRYFSGGIFWLFA